MVSVRPLNAFKSFHVKKKVEAKGKKMSREIGTHLYHHQSSLVKCQPLMSKGQPHKRPQQCSLHTRPKVNNASAFSEQYSSSSTINTPTRTYGGLYRRTSTKKGEIQFRNRKILNWKCLGVCVMCMCRLRHQHLNAMENSEWYLDLGWTNANVTIDI